MNYDSNIKCKEHYAKIRLKKQNEFLPEGYKILKSGIVQEKDLLWGLFTEEWSGKNTAHFIGCDIENDTWGVCSRI